MPELEAAAAPVAALSGVPPEYQPAMSAADEYVRLRMEAWRVRAAALRGGSMKRLRDADQIERDSLHALQPVRSALGGG